MRWFLYNGLLSQGFENLHKSLKGWEQNPQYEMTNSIKSILSVSYNLQINVLAGALLYLCLFLV